MLGEQVIDACPHGVDMMMCGVSQLVKAKDAGYDDKTKK